MATKTFITDYDATAANNTLNAGTSTDKTVATADDLQSLWRATMAALAMYNDDLGGVTSAGGTATAVTITSVQSWTAYGSSDAQIGNGTLLAMKMTADATGAATLNVNGIGTKAIRRQGDSAIQASDWLNGGIYLLRYDTAYNAAAGAWVLLNPALSAVVPIAATAAQFWAASSATVFIPPSVLTSAGALVSLSDGASIALDMSSGVNFTVTLGGNRTLANQSNQIIGRSGIIYVVQDATGSRTLAYGSNYKFAGGTAPVLSTTASAVDRLTYFVRTSTHIDIDISKDRK